MSQGGVARVVVLDTVSAIRCDRRRIAGAIRQRRCRVLAAVRAGVQAGADPSVDRDLRDLNQLRDMHGELGCQVRWLEAAAGPAASSGRVRLDLPDWLCDALPSDRHRHLVRLRAEGQTWAEVGGTLGLQPTNAAAMYREVRDACALWREVLRAQREAWGRREIARRLGLRRWAVAAILEHAPPEAWPPPMHRRAAGAGAPRASGPRPRRPPTVVESSAHPTAPAGRENDIRRRDAEGVPVAADDGIWRVLGVEPGYEIHVKVEIERRFGVPCRAFVAPGRTVPALRGLVAVRGAVELPLDHVWGWTGPPLLESGPRGRRASSQPAAVPEEQMGALFYALGWSRANSGGGGAGCLRPDQRVRIASGPFRGQVGVCRQAARRGRIAVRLESGLVVDVAEADVSGA